MLAINTDKTRLILNPKRIDMIILSELKQSNLQAELTIYLTPKDGVNVKPIIQFFDSIDEALTVFTKLSSALAE